jgi:hypothetical protein
MTEELERAIVRICTGSRIYVGVGVFVSYKHVLTCAHVVSDALQRSRSQQDRPTDTVYLDFPFVAPGRLVAAKVVFWRAVQADQSVLPEMGEDIAGLELEELPPLAASPIALHRSVKSSKLEGHKFEVFGIPAGNPQGSWADGIVLKRLANGWVQIQDKEQSGFQIEAGFSGSPVWDKKLRAVIGITVATDPKRPQAKVGFMIPTKALFKAWADLEEIKVFEFQQLALGLLPQDYPFRFNDEHQAILEQKRREMRLQANEAKLIMQKVTYGIIQDSSSAGIDYTELDDLLASHQWEAADHKTFTLLCEILNASIYQDHKQGQYLGEGSSRVWIESILFKTSVLNLPCKDLKTIDRLWMKYSSGRFGFSSQMELWTSIGANKDLTQNEIQLLFAAKLGWLNRETMLFVQAPNYSLQAPKGHLPVTASVGFGTKYKTMYSDDPHPSCEITYYSEEAKRSFVDKWYCSDSSTEAVSGFCFFKDILSCLSHCND